MAVSLGYRQSPEHVRKRVEVKAKTLAEKAKPFTKEWLESKYIDERLDCVQIGKIAQRDPKTIWSWLKYYDIPTRPRGGNTLPNVDRQFIGEEA